jgi:hypothetical protein
MLNPEHVLHGEIEITTENVKRVGKLSRRSLGFVVRHRDELSVCPRRRGYVGFGMMEPYF